MTCISDPKLRTCSLDTPEDAHQGQTTLCRNLGERGGGCIFGGGVLVGEYGITRKYAHPITSNRKALDWLCSTVKEVGLRNEGWLL